MSQLNQNLFPQCEMGKDNTAVSWNLQLGKEAKTKALRFSSKADREATLIRESLIKINEEREARVSNIKEGSERSALTEDIPERGGSLIKARRQRGADVKGWKPPLQVLVFRWSNELIRDYDQLEDKLYALGWDKRADYEVGVRRYFRGLIAPRLITLPSEFQKFNLLDMYHIVVQTSCAFEVQELENMLLTSEGEKHVVRVTELGLSITFQIGLGKFL